MAHDHCAVRGDRCCAAVEAARKKPESEHLPLGPAECFECRVCADRPDHERAIGGDCTGDAVEHTVGKVAETRHHSVAPAERSGVARGVVRSPDHDLAVRRSGGGLAVAAVRKKPEARHHSVGPPEGFIARIADHDSAVRGDVSGRTFRVTVERAEPGHRPAGPPERFGAGRAERLSHHDRAVGGYAMGLGAGVIAAGRKVTEREHRATAPAECFVAAERAEREPHHDRAVGGHVRSGAPDPATHKVPERREARSPTQLREQHKRDRQQRGEVHRAVILRVRRTTAVCPGLPYARLRLVGVRCLTGDPAHAASG